MKTLVKTFEALYGERHELSVFSPGRVNLIGEHTDYNGGHVFPCALSFGTYALVRPRTDRQYRFYSLNFPQVGIVEGQLNHITNQAADEWVNYPKGVIDIFQKRFGQFVHGFDVLFYGNIPNGAGLSSSASLELAMAVVLQTVFQLEIEMIEMVKMCQQAENQFIGVNCGIMDQFAIGMGKANHAVLLNCQTLQYRYSPLDLADYQIVIANTNKRRGLADSKYNERRGETTRALQELQSIIQISSLGDLSHRTFDQLAELLHDETIRKRAKHAVYENQRTLAAVEALENQDLARFGELMTASHASLRDDYEVTGIELDTLVQVALEQSGVIGSRMTGAGFGGCTVSIVAKSKIDEFQINVADSYAQVVGYEPTFYVADIADGVHVLTPEEEGRIILNEA